MTRGKKAVVVGLVAVAVVLLDLVAGYAVAGPPCSRSWR